MLRHAALLWSLACAGALLLAQDQQPVVAQALQSTRIVHCPDLAPFDAAAPQEREKALTRFVEVLRHLPVGEAPARSLGLTIGTSQRGPVLMARGTQEQLALVTRAVQQLSVPAATGTRLQITLARVPMVVAQAHRLLPGATLAAEPAALSELLRDVGRQKGSVHNLTEVVTAPLAPFTRQAAVAAAAADRRPLRVRGEVVLLGEGEVALALDVGRGALGGETPRAASTVAKPLFRLAAGKSAMMMALEGETALVVIAHCLDVPAAPGK
jgi:hypothetical protein